MAILSVEMLEKAGACRSEIKRFRNLFGNKVNITQKLCLQYVNEFSWIWAIYKLTNYEKEYVSDHNDYHKLRTKYNIYQIWAILFARLYNLKENAARRKQLRK